MIEAIFGSGKELDALQMAARAFVLFFITLVLIRVGGMRSFGRKSAFDTIVVIMLGAVLSRAVVGVSPFWPTVTGAAVLVVIHRLISMATSKWPALERLVKGTPTVLYRDGHDDERAMLLGGISRGDLDEAARANGLVPDHTEVDLIVMETSGELTVTYDGAVAR